MMLNQPQEQTLWGHPKGLYVLFFTELWERFSYYGMRAILILYLTAQTTELNAGLGWDKVSALEIYGWYTMFVYVMSVPGGLLADRFIGQKKAVMVGGVFIIVGHFFLVFPELWAFYVGAASIIIGVGCLKPNISSMVGGLYQRGDIKRDTAFTIFYIGINIGAFTAPLIVGYVGEVINWNLGFGLAGVGMTLGLIVYMWGQKYLKEIGNFVPVVREIGTNKSVPLTVIEKDRMIVLLLSFLIVIVFWGAYEQAGGLMNLYARDKIDRVMFGVTIPASFLQSLHAFYVILFGVPVAYFWTKWRSKGRESSSLFKMGLGTIITGLGFLLLAFAALETASSLDGKASIYWMFGAYFLHVIGELSISPVALSFITKLAPIKYASLMMGAYFMVSGLGNKLAGIIGEAAQNAGEFTIFMGVLIFCVSFGLLLIVFVKKLKKLTHGADDDEQKIVMVEAE
ncbi:peptide MFS transporter [Lutibacter sp.]|uniref:peptide MFS transporter n=1 Tax=Lutibacter sp. TaxID=1925666 RepID=UPI002735E044|nr:peptide MFS transporter [Lutibacter sp.]MDP3311792.1 peptide MFS transporter [Lutibacter sp.]